MNFVPSQRFVSHTPDPPDQFTTASAACQLPIDSIPSGSSATGETKNPTINYIFNGAMPSNVPRTNDTFSKKLSNPNSSNRNDNFNNDGAYGFSQGGGDRYVISPTDASFGRPYSAYDGRGDYVAGGSSASTNRGRHNHSNDGDNYSGNGDNISWNNRQANEWYGGQRGGHGGGINSSGSYNTGRGVWINPGRRNRWHAGAYYSGNADNMASDSAQGEQSYNDGSSDRYYSPDNNSSGTPNYPSTNNRNHAFVPRGGFHNSNNQGPPSFRGGSWSFSNRGRPTWWNRGRGGRWNGGRGQWSNYETFAPSKDQNNPNGEAREYNRNGNFRNYTNTSSNNTNMDKNGSTDNNGKHNKKDNKNQIDPKFISEIIRELNARGAVPTATTRKSYTRNRHLSTSSSSSTTTTTDSSTASSSSSSISSSSDEHKGHKSRKKIDTVSKAVKVKKDFHYSTKDTNKNSKIRNQAGRNTKKDENTAAKTHRSTKKHHTTAKPGPVLKKSAKRRKQQAESYTSDDESLTEKSESDSDGSETGNQRRASKSKKARNRSHQKKTKDEKRGDSSNSKNKKSGSVQKVAGKSDGGTDSETKSNAADPMTEDHNDHREKEKE